MVSRDSLYAVVLAGGAGTRFWPLSREARPKQLLSFSGEGSLLYRTFERVAPMIRPEHWWMIVGKNHARECIDAVPQIDSKRALVEPVARNTAPALGLAAVNLLHIDPDAVLVVLSADHHVADSIAFLQALELAAKSAKQGNIVTLGIRPTRPETGYGYIQRGGQVEDHEGIYHIKRFCEKPDYVKAQGFLAQGDFEWNAGIFVMRADVLLKEMAKQLPELYKNMMVLADSIGSEDYETLLAENYGKLEKVSIDYGIMEQANNLQVVPVECGWSDVGSFDALDVILTADDDKNMTFGTTISINSKNSTLLSSEESVVAVLGVSDIIVVHTSDATLVLPKGKGQEVRDITDKLRDGGLKEFL